ncbi:MAG: TetR/AcrR family transcriptional regulator [Actinomycetota bacterium]
MGRYQLKRRAEQMEQTSRRIARATFELHGSIGPAYTTISAIAERAGVQRLTVYRHFPDELSLFRACTSYGYHAHPPPDPSPWWEIGDPDARLRRALTDLYGYYRRTAEIWTKVLRDLPLKPTLAEVNRPFFEQMARVRDRLAGGWGARGRSKALLRAAIGHAMDFRTWRSLTVDQGLEDPQVVEVMATAAGCLAGGSAAMKPSGLRA